MIELENFCSVVYSIMLLIFVGSYIMPFDFQFISGFSHSSNVWIFLSWLGKKRIFAARFSVCDSSPLSVPFVKIELTKQLYKTRFTNNDSLSIYQIVRKHIYKNKKRQMTKPFMSFHNQLKVDDSPLLMKPKPQIPMFFPITKFYKTHQLEVKISSHFNSFYNFTNQREIKGKIQNMDIIKRRYLSNKKILFCQQINFSTA